ncbi:MAG: DUF4332 domain-containing protein [Thermoplasmatota archaeon]
MARAKERVALQAFPASARERFLKRFQRTAAATGIPVAELEGVGPRFAERLLALGIADSEQLIRADAKDLARRTKAHYRDVRKWQDMAELVHVDGIGPHVAAILVRCDVNSVAELAQSDVKALAARIEAHLATPANAVAAVAVGPKEVGRWVKSAQKVAALPKNAAGLALQSVPTDSRDAKGDPEEGPAESVDDKELAHDAAKEAERGFLHRFARDATSVDVPAPRRPRTHSLFQIRGVLVECDHCRHQFRVRGGGEVECPKCHAILEVLAPPEALPAEAGLAVGEDKAAKKAERQALRVAQKEAQSAHKEAARREAEARKRDEEARRDSQRKAAAEAKAHQDAEEASQRAADEERQAREAAQKAQEIAAANARREGEAARDRSVKAREAAKAEETRVAQARSEERAAAHEAKERVSRRGPAGKRVPPPERAADAPSPDPVVAGGVPPGRSLWEEAVSHPLPGTHHLEGDWASGVRSGTGYEKPDSWTGLRGEARFARAPPAPRQPVRLPDGTSPFAKLPEDRHLREAPRLPDGSSPFSRLPDDDRPPVPPPRLSDGSSPFVVLPEDRTQDAARVHAFGHPAGREYTTKAGFRVKETLLPVAAPEPVELGNRDRRKAERDQQKERRERQREQRRLQIDAAREQARVREGERRAAAAERREKEREARAKRPVVTPTSPGEADEEVSSESDVTFVELPAGRPKGGAKRAAAPQGAVVEAPHEASTPDAAVAPSLGKGLPSVDVQRKQAAGAEKERQNAADREKRERSQREAREALEARRRAEKEAAKLYRETRLAERRARRQARPEKAVAPRQEVVTPDGSESTGEGVGAGLEASTTARTEEVTPAPVPDGDGAAREAKVAARQAAKEEERLRRLAQKEAARVRASEERQAKERLRTERREKEEAERSARMEAARIRKELEARQEEAKRRQDEEAQRAEREEAARVRKEEESAEEAKRLQRVEAERAHEAERVEREEAERARDAKRLLEEADRTREAERLEREERSRKAEESPAIATADRRDASSEVESGHPQPLAVEAAAPPAWEPPDGGQPAMAAPSTSVTRTPPQVIPAVPARLGAPPERDEAPQRTPDQVIPAVQVAPWEPGAARAEPAWVRSGASPSDAWDPARRTRPHGEPARTSAAVNATPGSARAAAAPGAADAKVAYDRARIDRLLEKHKAS